MHIRGVVAFCLLMTLSSLVACQEPEVPKKASGKTPPRVPPAKKSIAPPPPAAEGKSDPDAAPLPELETKKPTKSSVAKKGAKPKKESEPEDVPEPLKGKGAKAATKELDPDDPPKGAKGAKEPEIDEPPIAIYLRRLGSEDNHVVRKRLVMAIMGLERDDARNAIPALLLAASPTEKDTGVRGAAMEALAKFRFKANEFVEVLTEAVKDETLELPLRRMSCKALAAFAPQPTIDEDLRKSAYKALEGILADPEAELRLAAATALDAIDRKLSGRQRVVHIILDIDGMKRLRITPEQALQSVQKAFPRAKVQPLHEGRVIEWVPNDPADTTLLSDFGRIPLFQRQESVIQLRELARITEAADRAKN